MYERYYQEFCNEVHKVVGAYLFWKMIQNRAAKDMAVLKALNETPLAWVMTRHALQVSLFMTLGRVFDSDSDAFSADDLLKECIAEIDGFNKESLRVRKLRATNGQIPDWLDQYIEEAYEPKEADFRRLRGELSKQRKTFEAVYRLIRHKLFAHTDKEFIGKSDELWKETNIDELESIIWFLFDLKETLFHVYENGRKPELANRRPDIQFYEDDYAALLDKVAS